MIGEDAATRQQFGARVRSLRKAKGLSQERLAQAAGIDRSHTGAIERGTVNVSIDSVAALARAIGVPIRELFVFDGEIAPDIPPEPASAAPV